MSIKFYKTLSPYGEFSNFHRKVYKIHGIKYKSSEHYYQSKKFEGTEFEEYIRNQRTPKKAAFEGRRKDLPLREDWDEVKNEIMITALYYKFKDEALRNLLLSTGEEKLIEDSPIDYYWGCGATGSGKNILGKQLMSLRTVIRKEDRYTRSMIKIITGMGKDDEDNLGKDEDEGVLLDG